MDKSTAQVAMVELQKLEHNMCFNLYSFTAKNLDTLTYLFLKSPLDNVDAKCGEKSIVTCDSFQTFFFVLRKRRTLISRFLLYALDLPAFYRWLV